VLLVRGPHAWIHRWNRSGVRAGRERYSARARPGVDAAASNHDARMMKITITPEWVGVLDFKDTLSERVECLKKYGRGTFQSCRSAAIFRLFRQRVRGASLLGFACVCRV